MPRPESTSGTRPCASRGFSASIPLSRWRRCTSAKVPAPWPLSGVSSQPWKASPHHSPRWLNPASRRRSDSLPSAPASPPDRPVRSPTHERTPPSTAAATPTPAAARASAAAPIAISRFPSTANGSSRSRVTQRDPGGDRHADDQPPAQAQAGALAVGDRQAVGGDPVRGQPVPGRQGGAGDRRGQAGEGGEGPAHPPDRERRRGDQGDQAAPRVGEQERHQQQAHPGGRERADREAPAGLAGRALGGPERPGHGQHGHDRQGVGVVERRAQPGQVAVADAEEHGKDLRAEGPDDGDDRRGADAGREHDRRARDQRAQPDPGGQGGQREHGLVAVDPALVRGRGPEDREHRPGREREHAADRHSRGRGLEGGAVPGGAKGGERGGHAERERQEGRGGPRAALAVAPIQGLPPARDRHGRPAREERDSEGDGKRSRLWAFQAVATMDRSVGPCAPGPRHLVPALLRRRVALLLLALFALSGLVLPAIGLADGRAILSDFEDNGQIDECYTRQEFQQALRLARADERVYGNAVDAIEEAQVTNVARPGEECQATVDGLGRGRRRRRGDRRLDRACGRSGPRGRRRRGMGPPQRPG